MIEIRKSINAYLKILHPRVYFLQAPEAAIYPYIVYSVTVYPDGEGSELVDLEVDGWDMNLTSDTTAIETMMATINGKLDDNGNPTGIDKKTLTTGVITVTFYNENMIPLLDSTDKAIHRRKYSYSGQLIRN